MDEQGCESPILKELTGLGYFGVCFFQLRLQIVEAVGHMTHIMEKDKLDEQLPKILQGILGLYKRHPDPYHITQVCLSSRLPLNWMRNFVL